MNNRPGVCDRNDSPFDEHPIRFGGLGYRCANCQKDCDEDASHDGSILSNLRNDERLCKSQNPDGKFRREPMFRKAPPSPTQERSPHGRFP